MEGLDAAGLVSIMFSCSCSVYVKDLTEQPVTSLQSAFEWLIEGSDNRTKAATCMNADSSRSHSIFTISIWNKTSEDEEARMWSRISIVDLAGSERQKRTLARGVRVREAGNINKSLMSLMRCFEVMKANQENGTRTMVPFRTCALTKIFSVSCLLPANCEPSAYHNCRTTLVERPLDKLR